MKLRALLPFVATTLFLIPSLRAETTSLELILDCSASMWNKLEDGRYRIDGAKQVLSEFIATTEASPDLHVGLRIYGSKVAFSKEGACQDSALVVPIDGFERQKMLEAVKKARAIGATPLARSLELAKEDFQKEGARRLIVFTDGEESCGGDVKAALDALKSVGVDVDVKIIGIGLTKEATKRFEEMGVPIENVHSAKKLAEALGKASELKVAEVVKAPLTLKLVKDGQPFVGVAPSMRGSLNGHNVELTAADEGVFTGQAEIGIYEVLVGERRFDNISIAQKEVNEVVIDLTEAPKVELKVEPQTGATIGGDTLVHFKNAKGIKGDYIVIAPEGSPDQAEPAWAYTGEEKEGNVTIQVYGEPGRYEARFITSINGRNVLAGRSAPFELKLPEITLKVPETVSAASVLAVEWTGPAGKADWIGWVKAGAEEGAWVLFTRPEKGKGTVTLPAPSEPGDYEVRYANDASSKVLARTPLKVVPAQYVLKSVESAMAGTPVEITWTAPKSPGVFITIVEEGAGDSAYTEYFYTEDSSSPTSLQAPRTTGKHEIRIGSEKTNTVLFKQPIVLTSMVATLEAPAKGPRESSIEVKWTGPNGKGDFITVTAPDAEEGAYLAYFYANETADQGKGDLKLPDASGQYEIRYVADNKVVARRPITVE